MTIIPERTPNFTSVKANCSLVTDFALDICDTVVDHDCVLLQPHLFLLELAGLLFQERDLVEVILLELTEIFFEVVDVLENLLQDVVKALCALVLKGRALRSQKLGVFLIIIQLLDAFFDVDLKEKFKDLDEYLEKHSDDKIQI